MEILLDGKELKTLDDIYNVFKEHFVDLHGNNLDALWDVLSYNEKDLTVTIINSVNLKDNLNKDYQRIIDLFNDLKLYNDQFTLLTDDENKH